MFIKVSDIVKTLDNHPYFLNLSDEEKIAVINIAISNFNNIMDYNNKLCLLAVPPNKLGEDGSLTTQFSIPSLSQIDLEPLSRFIYRDIETMTESFLSEISDEAKKIIYSIAVSKIRSLQPNLYEVASSMDSVLGRTNKSVQMNLLLSRSYSFTYPDIRELSFNLSLQSNVNIFGSGTFSLELPLKFYYEIVENPGSIVEFNLPLRNEYKIYNPVEINMNLSLLNGYIQPVESTYEMELSLVPFYECVVV